MDTDNSFDVHDLHEVLKKKGLFQWVLSENVLYPSNGYVDFWLENDDIPGRSWQLRPPKMTMGLDKQDQ